MNVMTFCFLEFVKRIGGKGLCVFCVCVCFFGSVCELVGVI